MAGGRPFATTGLRVPALLVSPHVAARQRVLGAARPHLDPAAARREVRGRQGLFEGGRPALAAARADFEALLAAPRAGPAPAFPTSLTGDARGGGEAVVAPIAGLFARAGAPGATEAPDTPNALAMDMCARKMQQDHPELIDQPGWEELRAYLRTNAPPQPGPKSE